MFENFRGVFLKTYDLDSSHCYSAPGCIWIESLKSIQIEVEPLTDIDMWLMIKKGIRSGKCHANLDMQQQI